MDSSPRPTSPNKRRGLGRRISDLHVHITSILPGHNHPTHLLASDVTGFLLFTLFATDWPSAWRAKLARVIPFSQPGSENLSTSFWNAFWQERWHQEDHSEARTDKWNPSLYKSPPPRMRSCREILNRQQALRNCCAGQSTDLEVPDVVSNMLVQVALAFCWLWAVLTDYKRLLCLVDAIENDGQGYREKFQGEVPVVVRKGEGTMPVARSGPSYCCLGRLQRHIDRGQDLIHKFVELEMCDGSGDALWTENEWLVEREGEIPAEMLEHDRFLVNRVIFSAGLSWLMVAISCDFATFYLLVLIRRLRAHCLPHYK
ncbi:hypothetical protein CORC01_00269 [Colletotrichum orchidophilum]|uniref:Uncharacterized protein n=1 Tax=Colletotrichum orchidophilum TaxID=1209926 RepID=A0A1G4BT34_9PEZI|nr:uncharacterized protein CORC01_00269 [Colletotrichum orchidophilum]OHF04417.1 hypothetical protein CORC01_00269 [Colletotrichum orchidophilum]